jgi:hypothetical protein
MRALWILLLLPALAGAQAMPDGYGCTHMQFNPDGTYYACEAIGSHAADPSFEFYFTPTVAAPEIDPARGIAAITLLAGLIACWPTRKRLAALR